MENKKLSREEKAALAEIREMRTMYRLLAACFAAALGIIAVIQLRPINRIAFFYEYLILPLVIVLAAVTVGAAVKMFAFSKKAKSDLPTVFDSADLLTVSAGALALVASYYISTGLDTLRIIGIIVLALLRLIYVLAPKTAFALSLQCALGVFPILAFSYVSSDTLKLILTIVSAAAALAVAVVCALLFASGKLKGIGRSFFYILAGVVIAAAVLSALIPGVYTYAIFTTFAVYLVLIVIYAIESM